MTSRLASLLVQDGLVSAKKMAEAFQRQVIYGGTLDTILLEMDIVDEQTLLEALARSSSLPIAGDLPLPEQLAALKLSEWMPLQMSERHRAVPVALDANVLRVLVIDPPDRKQLDELGYTLSLTIEPIIVPEYRFVQAVEMVYGAQVPARFASLAAKLVKRAADPSRPRPKPAPVVTQAPPEPVPIAIAINDEGKGVTIIPAPAVTIIQPKPVAVVEAPVAEAVPVAAAPTAAAVEAATATPQVELGSGPTARETPAAKAHMALDVPATADVPATLAPPENVAATPALDEQRRVVTDVPMPGVKPASAPNVEAAELEERAATRRAPAEAAAAPAAGYAHAPAGGVPSPPTPLEPEEARAAIDAAEDRDGIFEALCRGARARLPFAAILTVHGDTAAGRLALGATWFDRVTLAAVAVPLDKPSAFRTASVGRAPYLGRIGENEVGTQLLASLGRKPPLPALLMPVVLRERAVALLYADADGNDLDADILAELSTLTAAAARSFQRLILRAKGGEYSRPAAAPVTAAPAGKLNTTESADGAVAGGWHRAEEPAAYRPTQPRFSMALVNAVKNELAVDKQRAVQMPPREDAAPAGELHDAPAAPLPDVEGLVTSLERGDEHAQMSGEALVAIGDRAASALVARLPGPLRLDRHTLRGATPPLAEHGPLLAVLARMGRAAREPLIERLGDPSLEVRYYATLALGELKSPDVVTPLGSRLYDPDAAVRRAAVEALAQFADSPQRRRLHEQLRGELPGPDGVRQRYAAEALGAFKDVESVPRLIELVKHSDFAVVGAARKSLVEITKQDFGNSRWRWRSWWERHRDEPRVEWMLDGLAHAEPEVRLSASDELRSLGRESFGYAFDLPKREREDARKRWVEWWREHGTKLQDKH